MNDRARNRTSEPVSWLHAAGVILILWAASSDAFAQARGFLVTEVHGTVMKPVGSGTSAVKALEWLRAGDRLRLSSDSSVALYRAQSAQLFVVEGPATVTVDTAGVLSNGKWIPARKLDPAYRSIRLDSRDLVQGSLVMRSSRDRARAISPEGVVDPLAAPRFAWEGAAQEWYIEIATDAGALVHRTRVAGNEFRLPPENSLREGERYVWSVASDAGESAAGDWTEFEVRKRSIPKPPLPTADATRTERLLYAAWLKSQGLHRAAARGLENLAR